MRLNLLYITIFFFCSEALGLYFGPTPPSSDSFYKPPSGFQDKPLGTVLKIRKTPTDIASIIVPINIEGAWDILVRSEDSRGQPVAVVSTIIKPHNADPSRLVVYNLAQDSASFDCSPTHAILQGTDPVENFIVNLEFSLRAGAACLNKGYYVMITNYETTADYKAAFTAGRLAGKNILNSIRGAMASQTLTGLEDPNIILAGFSGGALASGWAAMLRKDYAPELNIIGAAMGGTPSNITETVLACDGNFCAGLVAAGVNGLTNEYPELVDILKSEMGVLEAINFKVALTLCFVPVFINYAYQKFFTGIIKYVQSGLTFLRTEPVIGILDDNTMAVEQGKEVPDIPIFMYHGKLDGIVPYINSERTSDMWCKSGIASLEFATDATGTHVTEFLVGIPAATAWIEKRFNGEGTVNGCVRNEYFSMLQYPDVDDDVLSLVQGLAATFLYGSLGPNEVTADDIPKLMEEGIIQDEGLAKKIFGF